MEFDYDLFEALDEAHSLLLHYRNHGGAAHCECKIAKWLREFWERYPDSMRREARRRQMKAVWKKRKAQLLEQKRVKGTK